MIAKVLVDIKSKNVDKTYDYIIPQKFIEILEIGTRVIVPFGKRYVMGFCLEIKDKSDYKKPLKEIDRIIDMESYLTEELINLAKQMKEETSSLLIKILETMLPAALKVVYKAKIKVINKDKVSKELLPYFEYSDELLLESVDSDLYTLVYKEIKKANIKQIYDIKSRNKDLRIKYLKLAVSTKLLG